MGIEFFLAGQGLAFTIYVVVQVIGVAVAPSRMRWIPLAPSPIMIGVLFWTLYAYHRGSSLWPIIMIFASPISAIAVVAILIAVWIGEKRSRSASSGRGSEAL